MTDYNEVVTTITPNKKLFELNLKETFMYRDLISLLVTRTFKARYKQMLLGPLWAVIQPLLTTVVFTVVFGKIANLPTDGAPQFMFYMCGNVLWAYFSSCLTGSSNVFTDNAYVFSKVYFPRLVSPIAGAMGNMINFAIQTFIFFGFLAFYAIKGIVTPVYYLIPLSVLLVLEVTLLSTGIGMLLASLTIKYRDLKMLVSFGVQLWLYGTPIAYSSVLVKEKLPQLYNLYMLNPMAPIVETMRKIYLGVGNINYKYLLISALVSIVFALIGIAAFNRTEKTFADKI